MGFLHLQITELLEKQNRWKDRDGQGNQYPFAFPTLQVTRVVKNNAENSKYVKNS